MECVLSGAAMRSFTRVLTCLNKLSDDVFLETDEGEPGLFLRGLNASHSAFASFRLDAAFFDSFVLDEDTSVHCQVASKVVMSVFRSLTQVQHLTIRIPQTQEAMEFVVGCKHNITKRFAFAAQECEVLQAVYDRAACRHCIACAPRLLSEYIGLFRPSLEELSFVATPQTLVMESYVDDAKADLNHLSTRVSVGVSDLDAFAIHAPHAAITFCLRDLKAILTFSELAHDRISLHFDSPSLPLLVSVRVDDGLSAEFVLATLFAEDDNLTPASSAQSTSQSRSQSTALGSASQAAAGDPSAKTEPTPSSEGSRRASPQAAGISPSLNDHLETPASHHEPELQEPPQKRLRSGPSPQAEASSAVPSSGQHDDDEDAHRDDGMVDADEDDFVAGTPPPESPPFPG